MMMMMMVNEWITEVITDRYLCLDYIGRIGDRDQLQIATRERWLQIVEYDRHLVDIVGQTNATAVFRLAVCPYVDADRCKFTASWHDDVREGYLKAKVQCDTVTRDRFHTFDDKQLQLLKSQDRVEYGRVEVVHGVVGCGCRCCCHELVRRCLAGHRCVLGRRRGAFALLSISFCKSDSRNKKKGKDSKLSIRPDDDELN